jgi:hypothetical protein
VLPRRATPCTESDLQAAGTFDEDFLVEYRDSEAGDHFCGDRRAKIAELVVLLTLYQPAPSA